MLFPQLYTTSAALSKCLGFLLANPSSLHLIEPYKEELVSCQRHNYPGTKMPSMWSHLVWANIDAYFYWISTSMWREVFCLEQASIKWTWAVVGAGCGKSHTFQGGCDDFQSVCNDAQHIQELGSHYLYCFFSLFSSMHQSTPLVLLLDAIISWKNYHFDQKICILYNSPNHCSQN